MNLIATVEEGNWKRNAIPCFRLLAVVYPCYREVINGVLAGLK